MVRELIAIIYIYSVSRIIEIQLFNFFSVLRSCGSATPELLKKQDFISHHYDNGYTFYIIRSKGKGGKVEK